MCSSHTPRAGDVSDGVIQRRGHAPFHPWGSIRCEPSKSWRLAMDGASGADLRRRRPWSATRVPTQASEATLRLKAATCTMQAAKAPVAAQQRLRERGLEGNMNHNERTIKITKKRTMMQDSNCKTMNKTESTKFGKTSGIIKNIKKINAERR